MELLASMRSPTRKGRSVCASKLMTCLGGLLLSRTLIWYCFRSFTNLPCLSVTVKMMFFRSTRRTNVEIGAVSSGESPLPVVAGSVVGAAFDGTADWAEAVGGCAAGAADAPG